MRRTIIPLLLLLAAPALADAGPFRDAQKKFARYRAAADAHRGGLAEAFRAAGATWPPKGIFLRAFKAEDTLELWAAPARGSAWVKVRTFDICAKSGALGPKTFEGDLQVPEGFYHVDRFNPTSRFHLSLGINYPHAGDRTRTPAGASPGGDIFIHGGCATIGCLPLRDAPMSALYVAAVAARDAGQRRIPVHVFPCRLDEASCQVTLARTAASRPWLMIFWAGLRAGYDAFERSKVPPTVRPDADGSYVVAGGR